MVDMRSLALTHLSKELDDGLQEMAKQNALEHIFTNVGEEDWPARPYEHLQKVWHEYGGYAVAQTPIDGKVMQPSVNWENETVATITRHLRGLAGVLHSEYRFAAALALQTKCE